jgi:hypothetical protein
LIEEIIERYNSFIGTQNISTDKLSVIKKAMQRLICYSNDLEIKFTLSWQMKVVEEANRMLTDDNGAYLKDLRRNGNL